MPFDETEQRIFQALDRPLAAFRSSMAATIEQLRGAIDQAVADRDEDDGSDLGQFAAGRLDTSRFEALIAKEKVAVEPATTERMERAFATLTELVARKEQLVRVHVEPGASLHYAVTGALAEVGRAFGAARTAALARGGRYRDDEHGTWLGGFPFARWNAAERALAPPLVVRVNGADVLAESLAEFLDGGLKIVLLVRGDAPPAPLARLITPGTYVAQVSDAADLAGLAAHPGTGIAAVVPAEAARFVHDPAGGETLAERLRVEHLPEPAPTHPLGTLSALQLGEPLAQLAALVATPKVEAGPLAEGDPAGKLAAWLLHQADFADLDS